MNENKCHSCRWSFMIDEAEYGASDLVMMCWPGGDISKERAADIPEQNNFCSDYMEL